MNNLHSYNEYLNEGFFGKVFGSKYQDIFKKIYDYILTMDVNNITHYDEPYNRYYRFVYKDGSMKDNDPYGEEVWDNDVEIKLEREYNFENPNSYRLYINDDRVPTKRWEAKKLYFLVKKRIDNKEEEEKLRRIGSAMEKIK